MEVIFFYQVYQNRENIRTKDRDSQYAVNQFKNAVIAAIVHHVKEQLQEFRFR